MATDPETGAGSFDPRTWTRAAPAAPPAPPTRPAENSFDPRSWAAPAPAAEPATSPLGSRRRLLIGAAAAAAAALGAGAWLARKPPSRSARAAGETPPTGRDVGATAVVQRQVMTLDGPGAIEAALAAQGLSPAAARGAATTAIGVLGKAAGAMRLDLATLKPAAAPRTPAEARLVSLQVKGADGSGVSVTPRGESFVAAKVGTATHAATEVVRGQVDAESFYTSAVSAGLPDASIPDFFQAFVYDFDFQREIEPGAVFEAALDETLNEQGAAVGARRLLYAAMTTAKKSLALYRYTAPEADAADPGWYDGSGRSIRRGLMRTPIEGARISSSFGWRVHPILGFQKLHTGTDFAAPVGTPIYAAGDAMVEWAAMKGPNGNLTILRHDNGWKTYYLHQNAFAPGVIAGATVRQGQTIGWVGVTGRSTGPHLHYELHVADQAVDAMAQRLDAGRALGGASLAAFVRQRDAIDRLRATSL